MKEHLIYHPMHKKSRTNSKRTFQKSFHETLQAMMRNTHHSTSKNKHTHTHKLPSHHKHRRAVFYTPGENQDEFQTSLHTDVNTQLVFSAQSSTNTRHKLSRNSYVEMTPHSASLVLRHLSAKDIGVYECRVDFFRSPTETSVHNLSVACKLFRKAS